jgi:carbon-monoxide dehydrogenase medium subunit
LRLHVVEDVLNGRELDDAAVAAAAKTAKEVVDPPSDIHAPSDYRRALVATLLERALRRSAA